MKNIQEELRKSSNQRQQANKKHLILQSVVIIVSIIITYPIVQWLFITEYEPQLKWEMINEAEYVALGKGGVEYKLVKSDDEWTCVCPNTFKTVDDARAIAEVTYLLINK